ncbi:MULTISPECIES: helicase-exonuclease AddAB subunit AddB [Bacillus]|uniref:helicase-exonuclease AddAB subunit AddB n=1 Tax=Bacillus TaxID=1386 RepID=UPI00031BCD68|nr:MULTISPECIES: helicase-exonuclease AddAB subunit AddB [Bacillus]
MSLQFIMGRAGTGKTSWIMNEIKSKLIENPGRNPIIYLVPDQMTFLSEYKIASDEELQGMISAQVFSFTRLAWRVLQETGGMSRTHLTSTGINMMITKIIEEKKDELKLFQRSASKTGFVSSMEEMLIEFKRFCISPEQLKETIHEKITQEDEHSFKDKLHDLEIIYSEFERALFGKYIDSEDYLTLLAEKISDSSYLKEAEIYIDGFFSLTPQELLVVQELLQNCKKVTISLTLDQSFRQGPPHEFYLFGMSARLYHTIYQLAIQSQIEINEDIILKEVWRFQDNTSLAHLENNFNIRPAIEYKGDSDVTVITASNRRSEIEAVAREIAYLVRTKECRWKDIALLVRNGQAYHDLIVTIFQDYQIPNFIDGKETMLHHPLIELIRSSLEIIHTNWRYEPVFRAIKTELLYPLGANKTALRVQVDQLENYVLSRGIKGDAWTKKDRWKYRRFRGLELEEKGQTDQEKAIENELNDLKVLFSEPLNRLNKRCQKAKTGLDYCKAIFLYLEEIAAPEKLEQLQIKAEEKGDVLTSRHHDQAWKSVVDLLDQFVETMGGTTLTTKQFATIIDSGLQAMNFSQVPPAIDQVLVANLDLSRLTDIKAAFVIGLNEGVLPMKANEEGILSDSDRQTLNKLGMEVAPNSTVRLLDEEFVAYKAFTTASEKLYVSYPLGDEEGGSLLPSPYIKRIREVIANVNEKYALNEPSVETEEEQLLYMVNKDVALSYLTSMLQMKKRGYHVDNIWFSLYNDLLDSKKYQVQHVLSSIFYENIARKLSSDTSKQLYGTHMKASVSRMEKYNSCAFSHFASHGLKLKERQIYRLEAPDIGELFHGALKIISDKLQQQNISWSALTKAECQRLANIAVEQLAPRLQNQILLSTNRHHYIKRKLENVISRASMVLSEQAKHSGFAPIKLELGFGFGDEGGLPPLTFTLANGVKMELVGRIDRVDKAVHGKEVFVRIIDYKSSTKDVNLDEVYYGLALQMLTYLDVIVSYASQLVGTNAHPAGMLYFHVHNPIIKANEMMDFDKIEKEIFKQFKMKGLLLENQDVLQLMDDHLIIGESSKSDIISASFLKNGNIGKTSKVASEEDFKLLRTHVHTIYEKAGNEIMDGHTIINPYKLKDRIPCTFCSYKSVCMFDSALEENQYRVLQPKKANEVMSSIIGKEECYE